VRFPFSKAPTGWVHDSCGTDAACRQFRNLLRRQLLDIAHIAQEVSVVPYAGVLSSLPAEALCTDLAASMSASPAAATRQPAAAAEQQAATAAHRPQASSWTFLINGALAAALDAAAAPPDGHHRVYAMAAVAAALEKVEELLKVRV
jgi:hypothetical protein